MRRRLTMAFGVVLTLGLAAMPAAASTFLSLSDQELVREADAIIEGQVVDVDTFWSDSGRLIVSEAVVAVDETLLGKTEAMVRVRTFGGQIGDFIVEATGFPKFTKGERVILFLTSESSDHSTRVLGYQQGHYEVVTRLDGVTLAVPTVDEGASYIDKQGALAPPPRSLEIREFKAHLVELAAAAGRSALEK